MFFCIILLLQNVLIMFVTSDSGNFRIAVIGDKMRDLNLDFVYSDEI